jgi:hypothetical protein
MVFEESGAVEILSNGREHRASCRERIQQQTAFPTTGRVTCGTLAVPYRTAR